MDESKKPVMIGVVVVCLVLAGFITYRTYFKSGSGGSSSSLTGAPGAAVWVKCQNDKCDSEYQILETEFVKLLEEARAAGAIGENSEIAVVCSKCGRKTLYMD
ncbi:MAG: hypothetical protein ACYS71_07315 [Planctomycetota bacterium]